MPVALTRELGRFIAGLRYDDIPQDAIPVIHTGYADCVGVMLAGAPEPAPQLLKTMLSPSGNEATLLFTKDRASALDTAWINGTAAHALDFDDVALRGHPSTVLVPAVIAEAEALNVTGQQMMLAYAVGYETWAELVRRDPDHQHTKGWHPTGVFGAIAAAAACASLHGLDAEKAAHAIAIGASHSCGLTSNFGSMTKPSHAGHAAHAGIAAARLAEIGFTAALDALEHPPGFLAAVSPAGRIDVETPIEAGVDWKLPRSRLSVKKYAVCFATHLALDGILDLARVNKIDPRRVSRVTVNVNRRHAIVLRNHAPQTGLEAKFSMEFAMAAALIAGRAGLGEVTDSFVLRPDVQSLMQRVVVVPDDEDPARPGFGMHDQVTLETIDGHRIESGHLTKIRGGPDLPLTREELWAKFEDCAQAGAAAVPRRELFDTLVALERLPRARELPGLASVTG